MIGTRGTPTAVVVRVTLEAGGRRTVHYFRDELHALALARRVARSGGRVLEVAATHTAEWPSLATPPDVDRDAWLPVGGGER